MSVAPTTKAIEWAHLAVDACREKLATDIKLIDVSERIGITDIFVLATAQNDRQVRAVVDAVEEKLDRIDVDPLRREGEQLGRWVLLDYGDIVVHIQHAEERTYYDLERLWKDCPELPLPEEKAPAE